MKKILSILSHSIISALLLNVLFFNVIESIETRFDNQGIYLFSVFMFSFAISIALSILLYSVIDLQKELNTLKKTINEKKDE